VLFRSELVVEIVSPDSGIADRRRKFAVYERYGVKEYWIVDQDEELVEVYLLETGSYVRAAVYAKEETVTSEAVGGLTVSLSDVFGTGS
jgi:Uma2 family endonuclease